MSALKTSQVHHDSMMQSLSMGQFFIALSYWYCIRILILIVRAMLCCATEAEVKQKPATRGKNPIASAEKVKVPAFKMKLPNCLWQTELYEAETGYKLIFIKNTRESFYCYIIGNLDNYTRVYVVHFQECWDGYINSLGPSQCFCFRLCSAFGMYLSSTQE